MIIKSYLRLEFEVLLCFPALCWCQSPYLGSVRQPARVAAPPSYLGESCARFGSHALFLLILPRLHARHTLQYQRTSTSSSKHTLYPFPTIQIGTLLLQKCCVHYKGHVAYALPNVNQEQPSPPEIATEDSDDISTTVLMDAEETPVLNSLVELRSEAGDGGLFQHESVMPATLNSSINFKNTFFCIPSS
jgi:hypothetical protein